MGRLVQPEDSVVAELEARVKQRAAAEVGVLVGRWSVGSKDVLLAVAATPPQDGVSPVEVSQSGSAAAASKASSSSKKPSGPTYTVRLDQDWIAEHANQVNRMLPGGLSILGLYLISPEGAFTAAAGQLAAVAAAIWSDAAALLGVPSSSTSAGAAGAGAGVGVDLPEDMLLLHVDSTTARLTAKSCPAASGVGAATALKPCEVKPGKVGSNLVKLTCSYAVTLSGAAKAAQELQQVLQAAAEREAARALAAAAVVDGNLYYPTSTSSSSGVDSAASSRVIGDCITGDSAAIQLYVTPACCLPDAPPPSSSSSSGGSFTLQGTVEAVAFVSKRDPVVKAVAEVKADISKSLRVRCELLCDEAASAAEEAAAAAEEAAAAGGSTSSSSRKVAAHPLLLAAGSGKAVAVALPRRVLLPFAAGTQVCDYLFSTPGADAAAEAAEACQHAAELLSLPGLRPQQVVDLEAPARRSSGAASKAVKGVAAAGGSSGSGSSGAACSGTVLAGAAAAAAVAALAAALAMLNA